MITRLATWWLRRRGYHLLPHSFIGVVLGHCTAAGSKYDMHAHNPSGVVWALNGTVAMLDEKKAAGG